MIRIKAHASDLYEKAIYLDFTQVGGERYYFQTKGDRDNFLENQPKDGYKIRSLLTLLTSLYKKKV